MEKTIYGKIDNQESITIKKNGTFKIMINDGFGASSISLTHAQVKDLVENIYQVTLDRGSNNEKA